MTRHSEQPSSGKVTNDTEPVPWLSPPRLTPGAIVRVIAPSGPFDRTLFLRGLGVIGARYHVRFDRVLFERTGYLAGDDETRQQALETALVEPGVQAIVCARGGYGLNRYVDAIDWSQLRRHPRWLVGFSDVTAIHVEAAVQRVCSLHAHNVTGLGRADAVLHQQWFDALECEPAAQSTHALQPLRAGEASGPLFGGNLTLLHACAVSGRLKVPQGAVVFIEDVSELPYRIDRMLTTLLRGGHLAPASALVLGQFTSCRPGRDGVTAQEALESCLRFVDVPVAQGLAVGHGRDNIPMVLGRVASLTVGEGQARLWWGGEQAV